MLNRQPRCVIFGPTLEIRKKKAQPTETNHKQQTPKTEAQKATRRLKLKALIVIERARQASSDQHKKTSDNLFSLAQLHIDRGPHRRRDTHRR